jgi:hypothetical protein
MNRTRTAAVIVFAATLGLSPFTLTRTQSAQDREAVQQAALDYVEGVYNVQPERIQRSVHPSLVKRGFYRKAAGAPYVESPMTFDQLVNLARTWNKEGKRDTSIKKIDVLDILDQTASVKVTASWGVDYMLLGKYDGVWKISQILWQSPPPPLDRLGAVPSFAEGPKR